MCKKCVAELREISFMGHHKSYCLLVLFDFMRK